MAVRGRNLANDVRGDKIVFTGAAALTSTSGLLAYALRSSVQLDEFTLQNTNTHTGSATSGGGSEVATLKVYYNGVGTTLAVATAVEGTARNSEFTTRDGTIAWETAYENAAARVFAKGSSFAVETSAGSNNGDVFVALLCHHEYGAPPA